MSVTEFMDPKINKFLTEYESRVQERREEILSKIGQEGFNELVEEAKKRDAARMEQWETYHLAKARALEGGDQSPEARLRATKEALKLVNDPAVKDLLSEDLARELGSFDAFGHLKEKIGLLIGDPDKIARDFRNRLGTIGGPIGEALAELTDYARFQGRFRQALENAPALKGETPEDRIVRVAEDHTQLGTGLRLIAEDPTGRVEALQQLGVDPSAIRQYAVNRVLRKFPELQETVEKKRDDFESFALAKNLYLQMGSNREKMADKLVESGQVQNVDEARQTIMAWLKEAHENLVKAKGSLPETKTFTPREGGVQEDDPFGIPPPPSESETGFRGFLQGAFRGFAEPWGALAEKLGDPTVSGAVGLTAPRPSRGDGFLANILSAQTFGEIAGWTAGMAPQFKAGGALASKLPGFLGRGVTGGALGLGAAESLTPEPVGVEERLKRGATAAVVAGGLGAVGKGVVGAARGLVGKTNPKAPEIKAPSIPEVSVPKKAIAPATAAPKEGRLPISEAKTLGGQIRKGPDNPNPAPRLKNIDESVSLARMNQALSGRAEPPKLPDISTPPPGEFKRQIVRDLDAINDTRKAAEFIHKGALRKSQAEMAKENLKMQEIKSLIPAGKRNSTGELITFAVEGTGDPRISGDTPQKVIQRLTKIRGASDAASRYRDIAEEGRKRLNGYAEKFLDTEEQKIKFIEDYVAHFWIAPKGKTIEQAVRSWRKAQGFGKSGPGPPIRTGGPPSAKHRTIPTFADGMAMGLQPKSLNAFDLHGMWAQANWRAIANQEAFRELRKLTSREGHPVFFPGGREFSQIENAADYETITSGLFRNGVAKVHKEIAPVVKQMVERPLSNRFGKYLTAYDAWNKVVNVSLSGFHHLALIESSWASMKGIPLIKPFLRIGGRDPLTRRRFFLQMPLNRSRKILKDEKAIDLLSEGGVQLRSFEPDVGFGMVYSHMQNMERWLDGAASKASGLGLLRAPAQASIKAAKLAPKAVRKSIELQNVVLWDYLHNGAKAYTYLEHLQHYAEKAARAEAKGKPIISKLTGKPITRAEIMDDVGNFVNSAYGGLEWQSQYWASPVLQKKLRSITFALDWTTANVKIATLPFSKKPIQRQLGLRYARNMAASLYASQAGLQWFVYNQFGGNEKNGDSPWMWENGPGKGFNVDMTPYFRSKGLWSPGEQRIYIGLGKQAREPFRWVTEPHNEALNKSSPRINVVMGTIEELHQSEYGWKLGGESLFDALSKKVGERFRPFSFSPTQFAFVVPKKQGLSAFAVQKQMESALKTFAEPIAWRSFDPRKWPQLVTSRDPKVIGAYEQLVEDMIDVSKRNGHDPGKLLKQALRSARAEFSNDLYTAWKNSPRDPKTGKIRVFEQKKMEEAAQKLALMDASLEYWKGKFKSKNVNLSNEEEREIDELVRRAFKAIR